MNPTKVVSFSQEMDIKGLLRRSLAFLCLMVALVFMSWGQVQTHHLIAGSFTDMKSANDLADALRLKGFNPLVLFPTSSSKYYRVSVYQASSREMAKAYKKQISGGDNFWVLGLDASTSTFGRVGNTPPAPSPAPAPTGTFHLVLGSFPDQESAEKSVLALQAQGFEPYLLFPDASAGNYRVSVYRSTNYREVKAYQDNLSRMGVNKGWIHKQTLPNAQPLPGAGQRVSLGTFHLIGASFKTFQQAETYANEQRLKGYNAVVLFPIQTGSTHYRVSLYQSGNKAEAQTFKKNRGLNKAWVYQQK